MPPDNRRSQLSWAFYDWANSAFATTVMAGFFPLFFKQYWSSGTEATVSTFWLGLGNSGASLLILIMAPLLGALADSGGMHKRLLAVFAAVGIMATASFFFVAQGAWPWAISIYVVAIIGFSGANVFYDAMLPSLTTPEDFHRLSALGYALGYLGGGLLFLVNVTMTLKPGWFGLADAAAAVRFSFLSVAVWWLVFSLPVLLGVREQAPTSSTGLALGKEVGKLWNTLKSIRQQRNLWLFLCAYWLYIDGVDTIIRMAVDYGMSLGFAVNDLLLALLVTQFVGFPAALAFGWLGQRVGPRKGIYIAIAVYVAATVWGIGMTRKAEFYVLAVMVGLVQGGIQALSRSFYARLIPADKPAEFFGFYNMLGKFAAIIGPVLVGGVGLLMRRLLMPANPSAEDLVRIGAMAARWSMGSVLILFFAGAVLLYFVDEEKGKRQAALLKGK